MTFDDAEDDVMDGERASKRPRDEEDEEEAGQTAGGGFDCLRVSDARIGVPRFPRRLIRMLVVGLANFEAATWLSLGVFAIVTPLVTQQQSR